MRTHETINNKPVQTQCDCCGKSDSQLTYQPAFRARVCFDCTFYIAGQAPETMGIHNTTEFFYDQ